MEVTLKKVKITSGIFNQLRFATYTQMISFKLLGYVVAKEARYLLFYDETTTTLVRYPYAKSLKIVHDIPNPGNVMYKVHYQTDKGYTYYREGDGSELAAQAALAQLAEIKEKADALGQIFM